MCVVSLPQPFTFPRFANSDRWFAVPIGTAVWLATFVWCLWHPLCKRPNCIFSLVTAPCMLPTASSLLIASIRCLWHYFLSDIANACLMVIKLRIRKNDYLSNNIRILTPKNRGCWSRKSHSVEKTLFFAVFGKALTDRWLRDCLSVNGQFTKSKFARGKVSLH